MNKLFKNVSSKTLSTIALVLTGAVTLLNLVADTKAKDEEKEELKAEILEELRK